MNETIDVIQSTGRRKRAVARVKLSLGQGVITVNGKPRRRVFPASPTAADRASAARSDAERLALRRPVKAEGGGVTGQAGAIRHGIARALLAIDESFKETLRKNGFLTRDPREKESKKYGRKRARKRFQYSKR